MNQQLLPSENQNSVKITIDERESRSFDELLRKLGAQVERRVLELGDFLCSDRTVVERKTRADFEASVIDGRLFSQLSDLKRNYERVVVVVEGEGSHGRIRREALLGAYATVITDYGTSLFFTRNEDGTAELVFSIAKHEQLAQKRPPRLFTKRKTLTIPETQKAILEGFPMIGPKAADAILRHFGNLENAINANERELMEVEGIGRKRAKTIRRIIEMEYCFDDK